MKLKNKVTGEVIEVPDDAGKVRSGAGDTIDVAKLRGEGIEKPFEVPSTNPFGSRPVSEAFNEGYESSLGSGPALVEGFNKIAQFTPGLGALKLPEGVGTDILDPALATNAGLISGAQALAQKLGPTGPQITGALSRGFRAVGERLGMSAREHQPTAAETEAQKEFVRTGTPTQETQPYEPYSTLSTPVNVVTGFGTDALNDPVGAVVMSRGGAEGTPVKGIRPVKTVVGKPPNAAVDLLQEQLRPGPQTRVGQEFETLGERGLENIAKEERKAPTKGKGADRLLENAGRSKKTIGQQFDEMHAEAEKNGLTFDRKAMKQEEARLKAQPFYEYVEPEIKAKFEDLLKGEGDISLREAHDILTKILEKKRAIDNRVGIGEDVSNATQKVEALNAIEGVIKKQLNEKLSRTPNEYMERSADYQSVASLEDLVRSAKTAARNSGDASLMKSFQDALHDIGWKAGAGTAVGFSLSGFNPVGAAIGGGAVVAVNVLQDILKKSARQRNMGKALNMAVKNPATPRAIGPQKPSLLPETASSKPLAISNIPEVRADPALLEKYGIKQSMMNPNHSMRYSAARGEYVPEITGEMQRPKGIDYETLIRNAEGEPEPVPVERPAPSASEGRVDWERIRAEIAKEKEMAGEQFKIAGGLQKEPVYKTPSWIGDVMKIARSPLEKYKDIQELQKIAKSNSKRTMAEVLNDPETSRFQSIVLEHLRKNPEMAEEALKELHDILRKKVHPF